MLGRKKNPRRHKFQEGENFFQGNTVLGNLICKMY